MTTPWTEQGMRQNGYRECSGSMHALLKDLGFAEHARRGPPYVRFWYPAAVVAMASERYLVWFGPEADRATVDRRDATLRAIAADPELEAALYAVWVSYGTSNADAAHAVFMYLMEALPELFGCLLPPGARGLRG
ncbi:hypothetical protein LCGC14_2183890 [marine sediment metagenome]|uniref:Uncharacterized protein n=1 Tax=marine sediment metagenome TaxID=412755 RepID=A0A0F9DLG7_9ZZZZ